MTMTGRGASQAYIRLIPAIVLQRSMNSAKESVAARDRVASPKAVNWSARHEPVGSACHRIICVNLRGCDHIHRIKLASTGTYRQTFDLDVRCPGCLGRHLLSVFSLRTSSA
jgi:hypothetical protein